MLRARLATRSIMSSRQISTTQVSTKVTYASDSSLPELPIPSLEQTAAKYLASTIPVHTDPSPSATSAVLPSYAVTEKLVNEFFSSPLGENAISI